MTNDRKERNRNGKASPRGDLLPAMLFDPDPVLPLLVLAHPDDETIGAGAQLPRWRAANMIYVTDGAPRNMDDARAAGFSIRLEYAEARRQELRKALAVAGVEPSKVIEFRFVDQEASFHLVEIVDLLWAAFRKLRPAALITHPYEGGHPDHDATAFAVHTACRLARRKTGSAPKIYEFTSYHNNSAGSMSTGSFLPRPALPMVTINLTPAQRSLKRRLYNCFVTQRKVLAGFPIGQELFRPAPNYDFTRPPHGGCLYYEMFDWGMTGRQWRRLAGEAQINLGLQPSPKRSHKKAAAMLIGV